VSAWPSFLRGQSAEEIHAHLNSGDPLRLSERAARRLREAWLLIEPDRAYLRAVGVCAEAAAIEAAPADLEEWALAKLDLAIAQLVREDRENDSVHPEAGDEEDFPLLTECLMIEPALARRYSVAFNRLEVLPRRAFFELLIEGRELSECIEGGPWNEEGLHDALQAALSVFGLDALPEPSTEDSPAEEGRGAKR